MDPLTLLGLTLTLALAICGIVGYRAMLVQLRQSEQDVFDTAFTDIVRHYNR